MPCSLVPPCTAYLFTGRLRVRSEGLCFDFKSQELTGCILFGRSTASASSACVYRGQGISLRGQQRLLPRQRESGPEGLEH